MKLSEMIDNSKYKERYFWEQLGVSRTSLWSIKTARIEPKKLVVEKLAELLEVTPAEVLKAWEVQKNEQTN